MSQPKVLIVEDDQPIRTLMVAAMRHEPLVRACEREHYKDYDWYARYGMVYYNFLKDRYTRK